MKTFLLIFSLLISFPSIATENDALQKPYHITPALFKALQEYVDFESDDIDIPEPGSVPLEVSEWETTENNTSSSATTEEAILTDEGWTNITTIKDFYFTCEHCHETIQNSHPIIHLANVHYTCALCNKTDNSSLAICQHIIKEHNPKQ